MRHCDKCKIDVRGNEDFCPLCQTPLTGDAQEALYPEVPTVYRQFRFFFKLLTAFTVSGGIVCVGINLMLPHSGFWSIFVVLGIMCFWISLIAVLKRRDNLFKNITFQVLALSLLCVALDFFIGWTGWSLNLFISITCTLAMLSLAVVAKVRKLPTEDYVVYLIADILFCIVPTVFYFTGLISIVLPSILCMAFSVITLVSLIVFEGKNLWLEVNKRFHL
jgi:hypothetical protein